jgi:hypothetical protein
LEDRRPKVSKALGEPLVFLRDLKKDFALKGGGEPVPTQHSIT